jgi:predicted nucleic acid-binding Zn ribbon protein
METKQCLECGETIRGRIDKKFCTDYCRNTYNNKVNKDSKNLIRNTNNRLRKNHKILLEINTSGNTYFYVYNQGYLALENDYYLLIKRD